MGDGVGLIVHDYQIPSHPRCLGDGELKHLTRSQAAAIDREKVVADFAAAYQLSPRHGGPFLIRQGNALGGEEAAQKEEVGGVFFAVGFDLHAPE